VLRAGKVRYLGHPNFAGRQVADPAWTARSTGRTPFVSAQNEYCLLERSVEAEVVPACQRFGLGLLPYFPLASGLLIGRYRRDSPAPPGTRLAMSSHQRCSPRRLGNTIERLQAFAEKRDVSLVEVAVAGSPRNRRSRP
jgi:aryl-alcohol dehydrogenase-like predicted oxidoreductase